MKLKNILIVLSLLAIIPQIWAQTAATQVTARNVIEERNRLARQDFWPGFDPTACPVLIYDGAKSYLFGHPSPPEDFQRDSLHPEMYVYPKRHRIAIANTSDQLGGRQVAVVCFDLADRQTAKEWAAVALHESFHVYEEEFHRGWFANEMDFFTYPVTDTEAVALRRMETAALNRALTAADENGRLAWAANAMDLRKQRFARIGTAASECERHLELAEGIAHYIEWQACKESFPETLPDSDYAVDQVRLRAYSTGRSIAILLDRCMPQWKMRLEADSALWLDSLLSECIQQKSVVPTIVNSELIAAARKKAGDDCRAYLANLGKQYDAFMNKPGWTLIVTAGADKRLWPQGFDPMNILNLGDGRLLHKRFVQLSNQAAFIEVLGRDALSRGAVINPISEGIMELVVTGLQREPIIGKVDGKTVISCDNLKATFQSPTVQRSGKTITVTL